MLAQGPCFVKCIAPFVERRYDINDVRAYVQSPLTIAVWGLPDETLEGVLRSSERLFEACIFQLGYLRDRCFELVDEWPRRGIRKRDFRPEVEEPGDPLRLMRVRFHSDTIRFYQRALATDDPFLQFLSFYQVLEYHFVRVSDEELYRKLTARLNDPAFRPAPARLDGLIRDAQSHDRLRMKDPDMLKGVLTRYVEHDALRRFVEDYEANLGAKLYTRKRLLYGVEILVQPEEGHLHGNIATTITTIRNALVHSSDRYEREKRYVPSPAAEKALQKEIPLMRFLAERVIIASAETPPEA